MKGGDARAASIKPISKPQSPLRWLILFLCCLMMIGNYYSYDNPAALKNQIDDYMGNPDDYETLFSLLYTVYSIPNIFLPFFGGYFITQWGVRVCLLLFSSLIAIGQVVFALGLSTKSWPLMFVGRTIFGFGGESLGVANSSILAEWFAGKELAFAFGLNLSIARLGSVINNIVSPSLADSVGVVFALWFSAIFCGNSILCVICMYPIDRGIEAKILAQNNGPALRLEETSDIGAPLISGEQEFGPPRTKQDDNESGAEEESVKLSDALKFPHAFWILVISCVVVYGCVLPFNNIASSLLLERDFFQEPSDSCKLEYPGCQNATNQPQDCPSSDNYKPPLPYDVIIDGVFYSQLTADDVDCTDDLWSDNGACTYEFCDRQSSGEIEATTVMSIPYIISACLSPILGGFVDKYGQRAVIAALSPALLVAVHLTLGLSKVNPIVPLVGQGLAYSGFAAVLWPSVPLVLEPKFIGLGYGVVTSVQNAGLASFPLIVAAIYSSSNDQYIPNVEMFFVSLAALGLLVGLYLNYYDLRHNSLFNSPTPEVSEGREDFKTMISDIQRLSDQEGCEDLDVDKAAHRKLSVGSFTSQEIQYRASSLDR